MSGDSHLGREKNKTKKSSFMVTVEQSKKMKMVRKS